MTPAHLATDAAASGFSGDLVIFGAPFFLAGFVFWFYTYARYRNTEKRFHHASQAQRVHTDMREVDDRVQSLEGLTRSSIDGANAR